MSPVAVCQICGARAWVNDSCRACSAHECERYDCDNAADDEHRHCEECCYTLECGDQRDHERDHMPGSM